MGSKNNIPPYLKEGDHVALVASARKVKRVELQLAIDLLHQWKLIPVFEEKLFEVDHQFAGSDEVRASHIQHFLDDKNTRALWFVRGGYGSIRIIDSLDFSKFVLDPKWLIGYSDITVFHSHVYAQFKIETIHATMPMSLANATSSSISSLKQALFGELNDYTFIGDYSIIEGSAEGVLVGGNLSILHGLLGSDSEIPEGDIILFIEDIDEMLYHIDRMLYSLKRAQILGRLKGLLVGGMTAMRDNTKVFGFSSDNAFGSDARAIVSRHMSTLNIPVAFGLPFGHEHDNQAIYLGRTVLFEVGEDKVRIKFA